MTKTVARSPLASRVASLTPRNGTTPEAKRPSDTTGIHADLSDAVAEMKARRALGFVHLKVAFGAGEILSSAVSFVEDGLAYPRTDGDHLAIIGREIDKANEAMFRREGYGHLECTLFFGALPGVGGGQIIGRKVEFAKTSKNGNSKHS